MIKVLRLYKDKSSDSRVLKIRLMVEFSTFFSIRSSDITRILIILFSE